MIAKNLQQKKFKITAGDLKQTDGWEAFVFNDLYPYNSKTKIGTNDFFMVLNTKVNMELSTLSHEAVHLAKDIFNYVHANFTTEDQEPFCYLVGWILDEAYKFLGVPLKLKNIIVK